MQRPFRLLLLAPGPAVGQILQSQIVTCADFTSAKYQCHTLAVTCISVDVQVELGKGPSILQLNYKQQQRQTPRHSARGGYTCALRRERVAKAGDWGTVSFPGWKGALCFGAGTGFWAGAGWAAARVLVASFGVWLRVTGRAGTGRTPRWP